MTRIDYESSLMRVFRKMGFESIAWSLRRVYCPVKKSDLVLEVGSGGSPYFRANVLCDAYEVTQERFFAPLVHDRPTIIAYVENLPFKDDSFDFVIASHVLEHSAYPEKFLSEIQRVAKAGYIEVPDAFMERLTHYPFHRLEITDKDSELIIRKKKHYIQDPEVVDLFHNKARPCFQKWASRFPFQFHVRYYWQKETGGIKYKIINPECDANWKEPNLEISSQEQTLSIVASLKQKTLAMIRYFFSQNARNHSLDLSNLLKCSQCHSQEVRVEAELGICQKCQAQLKIYQPNMK